MRSDSQTPSSWNPFRPSHWQSDLFWSAFLPLVILGGFFVCFSSPWWRASYDNYRHQLPFESATWKSATKDFDSQWPIRLRMVDDLQASKILEGKTRAEVIALLGPGNGDATYIAYVLGPERGFIRIDHEALMIHFGTNGRVSHYEISRD